MYCTAQFASVMQSISFDLLYIKSTQKIKVAQLLKYQNLNLKLDSKSVIYLSTIEIIFVNALILQYISCIASSIRVSLISIYDQER